MSIHSSKTDFYESTHNTIDSSLLCFYTKIGYNQKNDHRLRGASHES